MKLHQIIKKQQKAWGDKAIEVGRHFPPVARCPFEILALDIGSGGGLPLNSLSVFYGYEDGGKSVLAAKAVGAFQRRFPKQKCAWVEIEGKHDSGWMRQLGVDTDALVLGEPEYAEQAVDQISQLMFADDIGLLVVDSIAALASKRELEQSADDADPGGASRAINELVRKTTLALRHGRQAGLPPTMIWINQIRMKIGVGPRQNPETLPGGNAQKFMARAVFRVHGKHKMVGDISKDEPVLLAQRITLQKHHMPICRKVSEYDMALRAFKEVTPGDTNDWAAAKQWATEMGWWEKVKGGGYQYTDPGTSEVHQFKTQAEAWAWLRLPGNLDRFVTAICERYYEHKLNRSPVKKSEDTGE